jgi:hypothetical protein
MIKVYVYTNLKDNNKKYFGQTSSTLDERAGSNFINYKESWRFYQALQDFGIESFTREIIFETENEDDADNMEIKMIKEFKTQDPEFGYNIQPGGKNFVMNEEIKKKIGEKVKTSKRFKKNNFKAHAKRVVSIDIETKETNVYDSLTDAANQLNLSRGNIGSICNGTGRAISLKGLLFIFESDFSKDDINTYISNYNKRKENRYSEERNKKVSESIKKSFESGKRSKESYEKKVICIESGEVYNSIKEAGEKTNTCYQNISQVCNGKRKTANGLHWSFLSSTTSQK